MLSAGMRRGEEGMHCSIGWRHSCMQPGITEIKNTITSLIFSRHKTREPTRTINPETDPSDFLWAEQAQCARAMCDIPFSHVRTTGREPITLPTRWGLRKAHTNPNPARAEPKPRDFVAASRERRPRDVPRTLALV